MPKCQPFNRDQISSENSKPRWSCRQQKGEIIANYWQNRKHLVFLIKPLGLLQSYLCTRFDRSIINGSFSSWNEVITGVPQGAILDSLLFNVFLNDIFVFISKYQLCNYADNKTLYKSGKYMKKIKNGLEMDFMILHKCFAKIT